MKSEISLLDVVVLTEDIIDQRLQKGHVGTVVEELAPNVYEVEFADNMGQTYAMLPLRAEQLLVLKYEPAMAA